MTDETKAEKAPKTKLVKMERDGQFADVHPAEVENYKLGDWREAGRAASKD